MKVLTFAALALLGIVAPLSGQQKFVQKIVPMPRSSLTNEQQERAAKALAPAQPDLKTFIARFPSATYRVWQSNPRSSRTHVDFSTKLRAEYLINLWYDVQFDHDYTEVVDSRISHFGVTDLHRVRRIHDGEVLKPIQFSADDLTAFSADSDAAIAKKGPPPPVTSATK